MSTLPRHLETAQKPSGQYRPKKNLDFTPDTQPETPDSNFSAYTERRCNEHPLLVTTNENNPLFSPIQHSSINLGLDYEEEGIEVSECSIPKAQPVMTPVAEKSTKRRMFEAIRAIAKSPIRDNNFGTKKELISALRGFAVSPVQREDMVSVDFHLQDKAANASIEVRSQALDVDNNHIYASPIETPRKDSVRKKHNFKYMGDTSPLSAGNLETHGTIHTPSLGARTQLDAKAFTPRVENEGNATIFSPETQEIFDLNNTLNGLSTRSNIGTILQSASYKGDAKSQSSSKVLEDYRAAVEDYRAAMEEYETEISQGSDNSNNCHGVLQQIERPLAIENTNEESFEIKREHAVSVIPEKSSIIDSLTLENEGSATDDHTDTASITGDFHMKKALSWDGRIEEIAGAPHIYYDGSGANCSEIDDHIPSKLDETSNEQGDTAASPVVLPRNQCDGKRLTIDTQAILEKEVLPAESPCISTGANVGYEEPSPSWAKRQRFSVRYNLPDISPEKTEDDELNIEGSGSTSSSAVTNPTSLLSPNLLDKASGVAFQRPTPNSEFRVDDKDNTTRIPQTNSERTHEHNKFAMPSVSLNLLDKVIEKDIIGGQDENAVSSTPTKSSVHEHAIRTPIDGENEDALNNNSGRPSEYKIERSGISGSTQGGDRIKSPVLLHRYSNGQDENAVSSTPTKSMVHEHAIRTPIAGENEDALNNNSGRPSEYKIERPGISGSTQGGGRIKSPGLLNRYSDFPDYGVQHSKHIQVPSCSPRKLMHHGKEQSDRKEQSDVLKDILKLNLGAALTKEILQSLVQGNSTTANVPNLGIQHVYTNYDRDDCSEVSSLGNTSILSGAALSTLSSMARNNPSASIENIIRDFNRMQSASTPLTSEATYDPLAPSTFNSKSQLNRGSYFDPHYGDTTQSAIRLNPPKIDSRKGKRARVLHRDFLKKEDIPAVAPGIMNDFEKLQEDIKKAEKEKKATVMANKKFDHSCDAMQNEKLMEKFERIETLECQRRWIEVQQKDSQLDRSYIPPSKKAQARAHLSSNKLSQSFDIPPTNDWFMESRTDVSENEPFSSLLVPSTANDPLDLIEEKKQKYESHADEINLTHDKQDANDTSVLNQTTCSKQKKKKKKKVLKKVAKMIRRKKKSNKDDEGSIGIASVTSSLNTTEDGGKKKHRFKFLTSLRRKNKSDVLGQNTSEKNDTSQIFEEEVGDISENFIIDTMGMEIEDLDDDELDESSAAESEKRSIESECAYTKLS